MTSPLCFHSDGVNGTLPAGFPGSNWFAQHILDACGGSGGGGGGSAANGGLLFGSAPSTLLTASGNVEAPSLPVALSPDADGQFVAASAAVPPTPMTQEDEIFLAQLQAMLQEPSGGAAGISSAATLGCSSHDDHPAASASPASAAPPAPAGTLGAPAGQMFHLPSRFRSAQAAADDSRRREHSDGAPLPLPLRAAKSMKTSPQSWPGSPVRAPLNASPSRLAWDGSRSKTLPAERSDFSGPRLQGAEVRLGGNFSLLASMDGANAASAEGTAAAAAVSPKRSASGGGLGSLSDEPQRSSGSGSASASASPSPSVVVSAKNAATPGVSRGEGSAGRGASQLPQQSSKGGGRFGQQIKPKSMTEKHRREKISEGMNRLRMVVDAHGDVASMLNYAVDYIQNMQAANKSLRLELLRRQLSCTCNASSDIGAGSLIQHLDALQK
ncbi:hypothetical protein CLOM_g15154 [Closterium sp. NIES-68]|nr:hypothetical protein CLOM_g15154 [Closterium sp. NIES-68]GJP59002.1 hypothetical protein CLOP_g6758 [Closterium sp. NIES-67]